ncbi:MAG: S41 family peptidase [Nitrospirae bacterium]|nr:S41 family peptidase [Candidatus Manganitrophaceae bacterium]
MIIFGVFGMSIFAGRDLEGKVTAETDSYEDLKLFSEVLSSLQKNYVEPVKSKELVYGAVKGMLNTLDAHSAFMPPEVYKEMQVDTKGEFGGLGLQIGMKENKLVVIAPIEGTPADVAGIKPGDVILKVDDQTLTKETSLMEAVNKMRGERGSKVHLTIQRDQVANPMTFELVRDIIRIQSVKSKVLEPGIGYVRLTQFQEQTAHDLTKAVSKLRESNIHSLILDLRNNPGGLLTSAVEVSEQFLESGKLIVFIKGRDGKRDEYIASNSAALKDIPLIVLVNEGSASASEIVSGALQDWGRAVVVGTQTFGKGSVQTILPLSDGSALRLTTAKYYTPKGRSIQNTGIDPDITVKPNLPKEVKNGPVLRERDLERHLKNELKPDSDKIEAPAPRPMEDATGISEPSPEKEEDIQLQKAIDLLKSWRIFKDLAPQLTAQKNSR